MADLGIKSMQLKVSTKPSCFPTISLHATRSAFMETTKSKSIQARGVTEKPEKMQKCCSELNIHRDAIFCKLWPK